MQKFFLQDDNFWKARATGKTPGILKGNLLQLMDHGDTLEK